MSKFIELISYEDANKVFMNIDEIEVVSEYEGVTVVKLSKRQKGFLVRESYEQVKHLIETGEPLDDGDIAENKTIDTKQAIEWLQQFDRNQLDQIIFGLYVGEDVSLYANPKFNWAQMKLLRTGLENDVDVSLYINLDFNDFQVLEICKGIEEGVDVSLYAKPDFDWQQMQEIREKLEKEKQEQDSKIANEPPDDGKLYRIQLGDYYIGLSKPDNKIHMGYNSEDNKYYQRIFTLPQIYKLDPRLLPLAVEVTT